MRTAWLRSLTIGLTISIFCISCINHSNNAMQQLDTFVYNEPDGIASLDPAVAVYRSSIWGCTHLFNGLVELDSTQQIAPCIAKRWSVDPSGLEWTFTLRSDVWFHIDACFGSKGTRTVKAADVQYSIERICDARTKSTGLWAFRTKILGANEFHQATKKGVNGHISGITVVNDTVVRITLTEPFAPFLAILTMPYASIVPKEAIELYQTEFGRHPVGTGPFKFGRWTQDVELILEKNSVYFKRDAAQKPLPYLNRISVTFLRDPKNEFLEFNRGQIDMISSVDGSFTPTIFQANGQLKAPYDKYQLFKAPAQSVEYYGILLDTTYPAARNVPLARSKYLRQALNYAIDRHRIVTYLLYGKATPATHGVLPPSMPGFSKETIGYNYNPQEARRLLRLAGFPDGKGCPPLLLQLGNSQRTASVAEAVQEQWREIGINVELRQVDFPQHLSMVRSGELAMWRTSWIGDYPDPENFLALFVSWNMAPNGPNSTRIHRADLDSLYRLALSPTLQLPERYALYNQMERIVLDESPWIFMYYDGLIRLTQPNVRGFTLDGSDRLVLERTFKTAN